MTSLAPFNRLVRLAARAFYDDLPPETTAAGQQQQHAQGTAVVVLDALTRRDGQWVREDDLAASLRMHPKQLRRVLRYLEEDKIVARDARKEPAPPKPASTIAKEEEGGEKEKEKEKAKLHVKSYCCLDYAQACDAVRYRIHRMRKRIKDELTADSRATIQHYVCPTPACGRRYSALDALRLLADDYESFRCEHCAGELVVEETEAQITCEEPGDGGGDDDNSASRRKRRRLEKLQDMQRRMDELLEPLQTQIRRVEGLAAPEFMSLRSWQRANSIIAAVTPAVPLPCRQEAAELQIGILLPDDGADQSGTSNGSGSKVFPPWMFKEGMDHTTTQTGGSAQANEDDDKKMSSNEEEEKCIVEQEYLKAYYEALEKQQQQQQQQLATNIRREDEDLKEEVDIEWEDG